MTNTRPNQPTPDSGIAIHWFRQDLRVADNPALNEAIAAGRLLPIYIFDEASDGAIAMGAASRCWLHHSLQDLNAQLQGQLKIFRGKAETVLHQLCEQHAITSVHWNRCYEPWRIARDTGLKQTLQNMNINVRSHNGSLLWEPWEILKKDQTPYKVYTPYYRRGCLLSGKPPRAPQVTMIDNARYAIGESGEFEDVTLEQLQLLPDHPWHTHMMTHWEVSEQAAHERLQDFLASDISNYQHGRDFPGQAAVSGLSSYLHWGQLSPHQIWHELQHRESDDNLDHFRRELAWREFCYYQLYHFPQLPRDNLQPRFDHFPWQQESPLLKLWQRGATGYPLVDAGMRELWQTGTMHNRVRMVVASFLVKNLNIHWHQGAQWFWDCLLDADLASNSANWQWVAGCGVDAAPYFRIFNPTTQGEKFDKLGEYTRRFVPELRELPDKYLFKPSAAPESVLRDAGVILGETYPVPIVDLKQSREQALQHFHGIREIDAAH